MPIYADRWFEIYSKDNMHTTPSIKPQINKSYMKTSYTNATQKSLKFSDINNINNIENIIDICISAK
jgi:hypothetical protein